MLIQNQCVILRLVYSIHLSLLLTSTPLVAGRYTQFFRNARGLALVFIPPIASTCISLLHFQKVAADHQEKYEKHAARFTELGGRTEPIGIINKHGTCYASATLQLLEAAHAALPQTFDDLMQRTNDGLIGAYKKTRTTAYIEPRWDFVGITDPTPFTEEWRRQNTDNYGTWVQQKIRNADGSYSTVELYPERANLAIGAHPEDVLKNFAKECSQLTQTAPQRDPLQLTTLKQINARQKQDGSAPILMVHNDQREQCIPPSSLEIKGDATQKYQLTAIIQHLLVTREIGGHFASHSHTICYARYKDQWFICNDHEVKPITETELHAALDKDARTTYSGRAQKVGHWLGSPHPTILLYVKT